MQMTVTLRGRTRFAALLHRLEQAADHRGDSPRVDRRNRRTWRQMVLGILVKRSTRLVALGQSIAPQRRAGSVKAVASSFQKTREGRARRDTESHESCSAFSGR